MSFRKKAFQPVPTRIKAILALPEPECIKDNRELLGTLNYVRRSIDGYTEITAPLVELSRKDLSKRPLSRTLLGPRNVKVLHARNVP